MRSIANQLNDSVVAISTMVDSSYPEGLSPEAHRWRRCMKVVEEAGEVTEALLGVVGENIRKGQTHDLNDVRLELFDVALAALGAVAHLDGNVTDVVFDFMERADFLAERLRAAVRASEHWRCDCVPDLGPAHCHACSPTGYPPVEWPCPFAPSVEEVAGDVD